MPKCKPKKLLVGSVFVKCDELNQKWMDLQLKFLKATITKHFDYVTFISRSDASEHFQNNSIVIPCTLPDVEKASDHTRGLIHLLNYFREKIDEYQFFLFLDMDAFPIRTDWLPRLKAAMGKKDIAAILRVENLETRLHSSVLFARPVALEKMEFSCGRIGVDLRGRPESDVRIDPYQKFPERRYAFPMIRSNKHEIHPLLCGVYFDMFYHHGSGSGRKLGMRGMSYWGHVHKIQTNVMETIDQLMENPSDFISYLAGWNPESYAKVGK